MHDASNAAATSIKAWYTNLLKGLERKYSSTFDTIVKEMIRSPNASISQKKRDSLKTVLSFLFTIVCTDDKVNLFEKLYHHNAQYRMEAVKYLVKNLEKMSFSDDSKGLLQNSIAERISDDSHKVVDEALKFDSASLIKIVGRSQLRDKLIDVLERTLETPQLWESAGLAAIKHLTSGEMCKTLSLESSTVIFMTVLPFLLQASRFNLPFAQQILKSSFAEKIPFIVACKTVVGASDDKQFICKTISQKLDSKNGLPPPAAILAYTKALGEQQLTASKVFYAMLVLSHSLDARIAPEISHKALTLIERFDRCLNVVEIADRQKWMSRAAMGDYPLNLNIACIKNIIHGTSFNPNSIIISENPAVTLTYRLFEYLIAGMYKNREKPTNHKLFAEAARNLLEQKCVTTAAKIQFLTNYFVIEFLPKSASCCDLSLQIHAIEYLNELLESPQVDTKIELRAFIRVLSGLRSPSESVRSAAFDTLVACVKIESKYASLIARLLERREEIRMDANQLPLILHTILQNPSTQDLRAILSEFVECVENPQYPDLYVALLLEALTHVNTEALLKASAVRVCKILSKEEPLTANQKSHTLSPYRSTIVRNFLMRFTQKTIEFVNNETTVCLALLQSIKAHNTNVQRNGKQSPVTSIAVGAFDEEMFNALNGKHQQQMINALVNSATFCDNSELTVSIGKFFKQITIDAKLCVNLLDEMVQCTSSVAAPETSRLAVQFAPESTLSTAELLKLDQWKCGVTWLEFLQNRVRVEELVAHFWFNINVCACFFFFRTSRRLSSSICLYRHCSLFCKNVWHYRINRASNIRNN